MLGRDPPRGITRSVNRHLIQRAGRIAAVVAAVAVGRMTVGSAQAQAKSVAVTEDQLRTAITRNPTDSVARAELARLLLERRADAAAAEVLAPLIRIDPQYGRDYLRAEVELRLGHVDQAASICQAALDRRETSLGRAQLGRIDCARNRYAAAAQQLNRALVLGDQNPQTQFALGRALLMLRRYFGDVRTLGAPNGVPGRIVDDHYLIERLPNRVDVFLAAPPGSAVYHLQRAADGGVDSLELRLAFARVWLETRHSARAVQAYESLEQRVRDSAIPRQRQADYYHRFARALLDTDRIEPYLERFRQAVYLDPKRYGPKLADAYRRAGRRYVQRGDLSGYTACLTAAINELPDDSDLHYQLGNALWEAGNTTGAVTQWRITLQLKPAHPDRDRILELMDALSNTPAP